MIEVLFAIGIFFGSDDATWYGDGGRCHDGYLRTCSPYLSGEQVYYAAVGTWRWGDTPYMVTVCRKKTTDCVKVWVRDFCRACKNGFGLIDLSPAAFKKLAPLSKGRINVTVDWWGYRNGR